MSDNLIRGLLCVGIFLILVITLILKKGKMPMKFALVWYVHACAIILLALIPNISGFLASIFGFQTSSNLVIGFLFVLLFLVIIALTVIVADQTTKINLLIQEISLLKERIDNEK